MSDLITPTLVRLDADLGGEKTDVIRALARVVGEAGRAVDVDRLAEDALARETTSPTGLNGGIAIPHCRTAGVSEPTLAFARLQPTVDFGAKDGAADLVFLIAAPDGGEATHLQLLTKLARALVKPDFTTALREAATPEAAAAAIMDVVSPAPAAAAAPAASSAAPAASSSAAPEAPAAAGSLVAVTACPTGIAHTYMAAEALEAAARKAGVELQVETQGSAGSTPLDPQVIEQASAVIFAVDVGVRDRARFAGKPVVSSGVKRAIDDADAMIAEALRNAGDPNAPTVEAASGESASTGGALEETWGQRVRRVLMTGVSYMIPFVAAGGLLIALGFLLGGYDITNAYGTIMVDNTLFQLPDPSALGLEHVLLDSGLMAYLGALFFVLGKTAFVFFIPALAGYIAYAIADRPGIAPGFVAGGLAANVFGVANADGLGAPASGYLGAIVGGVLAGLLAHYLATRRTPAWLRGLMPVLVIPLVTSLVVGFLMIAVVNRPLGWVMDRLTDGLNSMGTGSAVLLGVVVGLMMAFDMGGPLNKVAYSVAVAGIGGAATLANGAPELKLMAAVMIAGMVPPLGLALATVLRPRLFNAAERENGKAAWLLGASFITEGAIPFAAADPLRVIPSIMLGSAVAGGLAEALSVGVRAPHGGIFVLFAVSNILGFLIALAVGTLVSAAMVVFLKSLGRDTAAA
ncbi:PTS fructose transporter subunit IIABC [Nocardioides bruguierae]|uniref:Fructose-specific PTS transporter subunit EIIC n=1 Tax=Nocardioides bruguierae TaxID=2945102 RepID=A0A9X2DBB5_9ACTN|nr:fructose-specific PTS transporter subunit EIIC [Nocardioides bruguierae]MCM0622232.1 fructose-specific PTS transporter subunit EIIC [Nocardioides bruguierae]